MLTSLHLVDIIFLGSQFSMSTSLPSNICIIALYRALVTPQDRLHSEKWEVLLPVVGSLSFFSAIQIYNIRVQHSSWLTISHL